MEPEGEEYVIRTVDLTKQYRSGDSKLVVFQNLELRVRRGERLALVGASGAGKSSLLHLLGGLDRPTTGTIYFEEREVTALSEDELADFRNREIGFVWQTHYLLPEFTALENVLMPLLMRGVSRREAEPRGRALLAEVGLEGRAHHLAGELSGGEQQRVVIARALIGNPKVLLADEPTGNLDENTAEVIASLFDDLHRNHQLTSIFVTHNVEFARRCNRVLKLDHGLLVDLQGENGSEKAARRDGTNYV